MSQQKLTYQDIHALKFQELKRMLPPDAAPYMDSLKPGWMAIEEKYAPLYAQASADKNESPNDSSNFKVKNSYEIKEDLDQYAIGQHEAKKVLSQVAFYHLSHVKREWESQRLNEDYIKASILLIGPTGSGKTLLANTLSRLLQVPFVKVDATSMTKTGFVGDSIQDAVRELYYMTEGDLKKAEAGIVLVDEVDKLAGGSTDDYISNSVVTGKGVQQELLRPMENSRIDLFSQTNMNSIREMLQGKDPENTKISTRNVLFILAGAFEGLDTVILKRKKREQGHSIGFGHSKPLTLNDVSLDEVQPEDLMEYGLIPELVGRITYIVPLERLDASKLYEVLKDSKGSIASQIEESTYQTTGKRIYFSDEALKTIAEQAENLQTGGRALTEISYRIMNEFLFHLPALNHLDEYEITPEFVKDYLPHTFRLIVRPQISQSMLQYPFISKSVDWQETAVEWIVQKLVEKEIVSVPKFVQDFMTSWEPILERILQEKETVRISDEILELFSQRRSEENEKIYQLLNQ